MRVISRRNNLIITFDTFKISSKMIMKLIIPILVIPQLVSAQFISIINGSTPTPTTFASACNTITIGAFLNQTRPASVTWEKYPQGQIIGSGSTINIQVNSSTDQKYRAIGGAFAGNSVIIRIIGQSNPLAFSSSIQGPTNVCREHGITYTQPENTNTDNYIWTYPPGFTGPTTTISTTNNSVYCGPNGMSGNITVARQNSCGIGPPISLYVTVNSTSIDMFQFDTIKSCESPFTINCNGSFSTYNWNTGANTSSILVANSGWYLCTATNSTGCITKDSLYVSLNQHTQTNIYITSCQSYLLPWGDTVMASGLYNHTYSTSKGCDSIVNAYITIYNDTILDSINLSGTSPFVLPWGQVVTSSGYYTHLYQNLNRCDSIITAYVSVNTPPDSIRKNIGINIENPQRNLHIQDAMRLEPRNTPLENPTKGDIYFDGSINKLRVYDGTVWQNCW